MARATTLQPDASPRRSGWVSFASYLLIAAGAFQFIAGLAALISPELYLATPSNLFVLDYTQWGWVHLLVGLILATGGASLLSGQLWGKAVGITAAMISAIVNFGFIWAYPILSILIIIMDMVIIYSIVMYGGGNEDY